MNVSIQSISQQSGIQFGTSGLRGLVSQMSYQVCYAYTMAFLQTIAIQPGQKVALGIDLRPSSPEIARACMDAVIAKGCQVDYCGQLPTPALAFYAKQQAMPAVMVTGSHIPFDRNGIKFYRAEGEITKQDEACINAATVDLSESSSNSCLPEVTQAALQCYQDRYLSLFDSSVLKGMKIGVYQHSSVARDLLPVILQALGANVVTIERTDHFVPIDTEAVSHEDELKAQAWSAEYGLDAIVTTDGDADRPLIADENGNWLRGDIVGLLTARFLGAKSVVTPISCNTALELSGNFAQVIRTRIGSPYVIAEMEALPADLHPVAGFEANGGFMAGEGLHVQGHSIDSLLTRDALLPILSLLVMGSDSISQKIESDPIRRKLSQLTEGLPERYTFSDRLQDIPNAFTRSLLDELLGNPALFTLSDFDLGALDTINSLDGVRLYFSHGDIIHLRGSGNAPELRCYAESSSPERSKQIVVATLAWVQNSLMGSDSINR